MSACLSCDGKWGCWNLLWEQTIHSVWWYANWSHKANRYLRTFTKHNCCTSKLCGCQFIHCLITWLLSRVQSQGISHMRLIFSALHFVHENSNKKVKFTRWCLYEDGWDRVVHGKVTKLWHDYLNTAGYMLRFDTVLCLLCSNGVFYTWLHV